MRVYQSPIQLRPSNIQKRSSINFVKNIAAPKQIKPQNIFNSQHFQPKEYQSRHEAQISYSFNQQQYCSLRKESHRLSVTIVCPASWLLHYSQRKSSLNCSNFNAIEDSFHYSSQTEIRDLFDFLHMHIQEGPFYFSSDNIYIDYILGLKRFKVQTLAELLNKDSFHSENPAFRKLQKKMPETCLKVKVCQFQDLQTKNYLKNFQIIKCVGSGGFSKVFLVKAFGKLMAMKVINKQYIISNDKTNIINNEKTILSVCSDHPFVTKLYASFETHNFLIFAMEFCNGGELFNLLRKVKKMKEEQAKFYFVEVLCAIAYLHKKGIVYRDIKPQNIIIDYEGHVRLADYGLSKLIEDNREAKSYSFCGSAEYMAPEMLLKKGHSYEIDFYCLGALLYELVVGLPPYYSRYQNELFSNIINNELQFPAHANISEQLKGILSKLLEKEVQNRYSTLNQILFDPWMRDIKLNQVFQKRLKPPFKTDMLSYNFDDSDFAQQEKQILQKLKHEQLYHEFDQFVFPNFFYESKQILDFKSFLAKSKQRNIDVRSGSCSIQSFVKQASRQGNTNNSSSKMLTKNYRQPSINRLNRQTTPNSPIPLQNAKKKIDVIKIFKEPSQTQNQGKFFYCSTFTPKARLVTSSKPELVSVRSLQHLNSSKSAQNHKRSQERIGSISKLSSNLQIPSNNIYTTSKQTLNRFEMKLNHANTSQFSSQNQICQPHISSAKSSQSGQVIRFDARNQKFKNQRKNSLEQQWDDLSLNNLSIGRNSSANFKLQTQKYDLQRSYFKETRQKKQQTKVKKSFLKNGDKISLNMLQNMLYRQ